jgi:hypothetical protein
MAFQGLTKNDLVHMLRFTWMLHYRPPACCGIAVFALLRPWHTKITLVHMLRFTWMLHYRPSAC